MGRRGWSGRRPTGAASLHDQERGHEPREEHHLAGDDEDRREARRCRASGAGGPGRGPDRRRLRSAGAAAATCPFRACRTRRGLEEPASPADPHEQRGHDQGATMARSRRITRRFVLHASWSIAGAAPPLIPCRRPAAPAGPAGRAARRRGPRRAGVVDGASACGPPRATKSRPSRRAPDEVDGLRPARRASAAGSRRAAPGTGHDLPLGLVPPTSTTGRTRTPARA